MIKNKKRTRILAFATIGIILISASAIFFVKFLAEDPPSDPPIEEIPDIDYALSDAHLIGLEGVNMSNFIIEGDFECGDLEIGFLPSTSEYSVQFTWDVLIRAQQGKNFSGAFQADFDYEVYANGLQLTLSTPIITGVNNGTVVDHRMELNIHPTFGNYSFFIKTKDANLKMNAEGEYHFNEVNISTVSGNCEVNMNRSYVQNDLYLSSGSGFLKFVCDHTQFEKNLFCNTVSSQLIIDFWNNIFTSAANVSFESETGAISVAWAQHTRKYNNISINVNSHANIRCRYWIPIEVMKGTLYYQGNDLSYFTGIDSGLWAQNSTNNFTSTNFYQTDLDEFHFNVNANDYQAYVRINDCFKFQRFCGSNIFLALIYPASTEGNVIIDNSFYGGAAVQFSNSTSNAAYEIKLLNESSTDLVFINWSLDYEVGGDRGYGSLEIGTDYEVMEGVLHVSLYLIYEEDRIRPIFTGGQIIISIHPDLAYNFD